MAKTFVLLPHQIDTLRGFFESMTGMAEAAGLTTEMLTAVEVMLDNPPPHGTYTHDGTSWQSQTQPAQAAPNTPNVDDQLAALKAKIATT